ncbi:hypothetical protein ACO2Q7_17170 [Rathayibacter sp. KR2-224]|uniref:hypothetical protein n=1 Tax=Rathayibacter sp. KR2-224 TaxID=3400913 RepID=UPI003C125149
MTFIPFNASVSEIEDPWVLRTEMTPCLRTEFAKWVIDISRNGSWVQAQVFVETANALDLDWRIAVSSPLLSLSQAVELLRSLSDRELLHMIDYLLSRGNRPGTVSLTLERARSAYALRRVEDGRAHHLTHKVPEVLIEAARDISSGNDAAGSF